MASTETATIESLFAGKPQNFRLFRQLQNAIETLGDIKTIVTSTQVSFGADRKFAWLWLAPVTKQSPEGVLMLTLDMTHKVTDPMLTSVEETYPGKWTHQIKVSDESDVKKILDAGWLVEGYKFGTKGDNSTP